MQSKKLHVVEANDMQQARLRSSKSSSTSIFTSGSASGSAKSRPMQQRGQLAREAILIAGEELFARFSYTGTTLDAVAKPAGLSKQNLIHYYANKPLLYGAVIEYAFKPIMDIINSVGGVDSAHLNLIERWIDILAERPNIARLIMFGAVLPEDSAIPPVFKDINLRGFQSFEVGFKRLVTNAIAKHKKLVLLSVESLIKTMQA